MAAMPAAVVAVGVTTDGTDAPTAGVDHVAATGMIMRTVCAAAPAVATANSMPQSPEHGKSTLVR